MGGRSPGVAPSGRELDHLIITRFNLRIREYGPAVDDDGLRHRLGLFRSFTLTSVRAQTSRSFRWFVLCDEDSPPWLLSELEAEPVVEVLRMGEWAVEAFVETIGPHVRRGARLVTTRLDNDDALATDLVERVQPLARPLDVGFILFPNGLFYSEGLLHCGRDDLNAFVTRVESTSARTVYEFPHIEVARHGPVVQHRDRMWIQVVHDCKVYNHVRGTLSSPDRFRDRFVIDAPLRRPRRIDLLSAEARLHGTRAALVLRHPAEAFRRLRRRLTGPE